MSQVIVRLYGRFVYAVPVDRTGETLGKVYAVAVEPSIDPALRRKAHTHRVLMTIPRRLTSRERAPSFDLTAGDDVQRAELGVWDLRNCALTIRGGKQPFELIRTDDPKRLILLPDLRVLLETADFDQRCLKPGAKRGLVSAVITLASGSAVTRQVEGGKANFAPFGDPTNISPVLKGTRLADMLEVTIEGDTLTVEIKGPRDRKPVPLTVSSVDDHATIISLSNLCVPGAQDTDVEFAAFYRVLKKFPLAKDRLVPVVAGGSEFAEDCYKSGLVTFIP